MQPLVSIIVPVYNIAPYLDACLNSLCSQTLKNIEIIIVNDNSTDGSLSIMQKYASQDQRIKIINHAQNMKTAAARNAGLEIARGKYVGFVDGDDFVDSNFYEKVYTLAETENADIAKGIHRVLQPDGKKIVINDNKSIRQKGKCHFIGNIWSAIYRLENIKKHNIRFYIDFFCFQIQAVYYANKIACADDAFYNYVRHDNSCDSSIFTLEKWQRLNIGHANFIYGWLSAHQYSPKEKEVYLKLVKSLYFYGYNKLSPHDILEGSNILAQAISQGYGCSYNIRGKKLRRKLFLLHPQTTLLQYWLYRIKGIL